MARNTLAKLSLAKAREIRKEYFENGLTQPQLAKKYEVNKSTIHKILANKTWKEPD